MFPTLINRRSNGRFCSLPRLKSAPFAPDSSSDMSALWRQEPAIQSIMPSRAETLQRKVGSIKASDPNEASKQINARLEALVAPLLLQDIRQSLLQDVRRRWPLLTRLNFGSISAEPGHRLHSIASISYGLEVWVQKSPTDTDRLSVSARLDPSWAFVPKPDDGETDSPRSRRGISETAVLRHGRCG